MTATKLIVGTDEGYALNITTTGFGALFRSTGSSANIPLVALNTATSGGNNIFSLQTDSNVERAAFRYDRTGDRLQLVANGNGLLVTGAATFSSSVADYGATITNIQDSSQGLLVRATDNDTSLYLLNLQSSNSTTGQTWVDRFAVTKGGNVGIGNNDPPSLLSMNTSSATAYDATVDDGQASSGSTLTIRNGSTTTNSFAQINMQVSADSGRALARIVGICKGSATSDMAFVTEDANVKSEKMRITSTGNVLIGTTTSTGAKLEINGDIRTGVLDTGYVSGFWKLGRAVIGTQPSETHQIIVEINGALFTIGAAAL